MREYTGVDNEREFLRVPPRCKYFLGYTVTGRDVRRYNVALAKFFKKEIERFSGSKAHGCQYGFCCGGRVWSGNACFVRFDKDKNELWRNRIPLVDCFGEIFVGITFFNKEQLTFGEASELKERFSERLRRIYPYFDFQFHINGVQSVDYWFKILLSE